MPRVATEAVVTAVVVNYRSGDDLDACLTALLQDRERLRRVVVVDNASGDASWEPAKRHAESDHRVELIRSKENLGLAGAVNLVLLEIDTQYLAVLNPDVTPSTGWLEPLVDHLEANPGDGVVCPLVLIESTGKVNSAGQHVHVTGLGFNRFLHRSPGDVPAQPHRVGGLHGAAFLIRTETLRRLGGWDASGFLYHEDVGLSWDVLLLGMGISCVPESRVEHDYHLTMYPEKLFLLERNRLTLLLTHLEISRLLFIVPALVLTEAMVWLLSLLRGPGFLAAKWHAYRQVWRRRDLIRRRRAEVRSRPVYEPAALHEATRWSYPLDQLGALGMERGESPRQPPGGLPVDLSG